MKTISHRILSIVVCTAAASLVSGCGPRGESHTVDQIFGDARSSYLSSYVLSSKTAPGEVKAVSDSLDKLAGEGGGGDARQISASVADNLTTLLPKSGFTQRAAMTELINQYRQIANSTGAPLTLGAPNLKLIAARTYTLLVAEFNSTQFRIS